MGIRILHRRTAPARTQAQAHADRAPSFTRRPVPLHSAAASTARIPVDLEILLRRARAAGPLVAALRHRLTRRDEDTVGEVERAESGGRRWAELALGYVALVLTLVPRSRPLPTMTVFVAAAGSVSEGLGEQSLSGHRTPEPGASS